MGLRTLSTALGPRLVLADEPTAHQDALRTQASCSMHSDARSTTAPGALVVSHDQAVVDRADQVVELTGGTLRTIGTS